MAMAGIVSCVAAAQLDNTLYVLRLCRRLLVAVLSVAWLMTCTGITWGYPVGPAVSLEKLTEEADTVFKGTAVSNVEVQDHWFEPVRRLRCLADAIQGRFCPQG